ncbi:MAG: bifunctional class I SAM-dependent methyltransferase/glycosyltransferase family 2 protein [Bacteroidota bacterium]|nr:bifunctional class I SAM-dependent methyltransferase/glycosyltransferase family 2 protein [Bacteroidota bacterium]
MIKYPHLDDLREQIAKKNDEITPKRIKWINANKYYYRQLVKHLSHIIEPGAKVMHLRCSIGYLLNELQPAVGVGIDDSGAQIAEAQRKYPNLEFHNQSPEATEVAGKFDYILITSVEDIIDLQAVMLCIKKNCYPHTRIVIVNYHFLWQPLVKLAEKLNLRIPQKQHNWISAWDINGICSISGYEPLINRRAILMPYNIPLISWFANKILARLPFFRFFTLHRINVARYLPDPNGDYSVSVCIPCRNEVGNIESAVLRVPMMGTHTEIIFGDDKSTDGTGDKVLEMIAKHPEKDIKLVPGPAICKATNVWSCFDSAQGDILMILDADLTVIPEELPYFYEAIARRRAEFVNGSRLVYPMHDEAMRLFNIIGNKFFSIAFSFVLDLTIKDTLCGTKVLWRSDYERIKKLRGSWGVNDRWGDYELIFGAAKKHLKILDLPVHYMERTYGETKMTDRFKNGRIMLSQVWAALWKIKFY